MKNLIIVILLVALGGGGFYLWKQQKNGGAQTQAEKIAARPTKAPALSTNISFSVTLAGEIGPADQVSVRPEVPGKINKLPVDIGDRVKKNELLFGLDDKDLQIELDTRTQEIDSAKLQLQKTRLRMDQAERDYERDKMLFEEKLVAEQVYETSKQTWDSAKTDYDISENSVKRAKSNYDLADEKLSKTQVLAPFDCTVLTRPVSIGQAVSGSGGFNSGTEVMTIANLTDLIIMAHVNQADVTRLKVGMEVNVKIEAISDLKVRGVVERISPQATIVNNIKGFSTRIRLSAPDQRVQPGMTANITIPVASADNVVAVPLAAVFTELNVELQQNERFVYLVIGDHFEKRKVSIGVADYFYAEVESGVQPGDIVAIEKPDETKVIKPTAPAAKPDQKLVDPKGKKNEQTKKSLTNLKSRYGIG
jgi:HlyD family secretion protein